MYKSHRYLVAMALLGSGVLWAQVAGPGTSARSSDVAITAVSGESWLTHLNRSFNDSSMGRTGRIGPASAEGGDFAPALSPVSLPSATATVKLGGSDLYRLNCRGCHGESGLGAPPEINSVINPVRATSVELVIQRVHNVGMDISRAEASKLAQQSNAAIMLRLHQGGESMPSFAQLSETEIGSLMAFLRELAEVPGAKNRQAAVTESHVRVGELIVKSTCHTCHNAVGPNPSPADLLNGAIPPLSSLTKRKNVPEFIQKVTQGAPVLMGTPAEPLRGRMPVFYYLTEEEAADVYLYLTLYPPTERTNATPVMASLQTAQPPSDSGTGSSSRAPVPSKEASAIRESDGVAQVQMAAMPWAEAFVALSLAGGVFFTLREFRLLAAKSAARRAAAAKLRSGSGPGWSMDAMRQSSFTERSAGATEIRMDDSQQS